MTNVGEGAIGFFEVIVFHIEVTSLKECGREEEGLLCPPSRRDTIAMEAFGPIP